MTPTTFDVDAFLRFFLEMDRKLTAHGFPPLSPWWRSEFERVLRALAASPGRLRQWILRGGRRLGKSTSWQKFSVAWALRGPWSVPAGDLGVIAFVSVNRDEAANRLRGIADILKALGIGHEKRAEEIVLRDRPCAFRVYTASVDSVGMTLILLVGDEVARWENRDHSANPARHVFGSMMPALATQPWGFAILSSSPWAREDFHCEAFDRGDTAYQRVSFAPTWVGNPTVTEADTHALEPDEKTWLREYAAIPSDALTSNWFGGAVDRAIDTGRSGPEPRLEGVTYHVACDQAFQKDQFAFAIATSQVGAWNEETRSRGPAATRVQEVGAWTPDRSPRDMALRLRDEILVRYGTRDVAIDQHSGLAFAQLAQDVGVRCTIVPWTSGDNETSKSTRYRAVRLGMLAGDIRIPDDPALLRDLRATRGILLPSGNERIEVARTVAGHGDRVAALVLATSIALSREPELAPSRESWLERRDRTREEHAIANGLIEVLQVDANGMLGRGPPGFRQWTTSPL